MGRKSILKNRKEKNQKVEQWTLAILPKLKTTDLGELTMDDLALLMKKSKSTIYQYFTTKEEIFEYITQVRIDYLYTYKNQITEEILKLDYKCETLGRILMEGAKDVSSFFLRQLQEHYPTAWKIIEEFLCALLEDLKQFYILGIENNIFKPISSELLVKLDEYFIRQLITDDNFFDQTEETLESIMRDYMFLKFEGLKK
ncbi:AcrR family transcriptional regulator [Aquimarina sp. EL_43]|uniref:TetR/AcrR family transcriptional regulator n=1 Tax=Aquimarina TaxID=290174 RepID=UPI00047262FC|nr:MULTISPECIES: TetR/AcrR family transcriptional regulator [Aquimarina]MBG6133504.1 AcrR family transcriptional regulator [Aquimarina sp. EL_35]MBG6153703.1 AcrR family transcriptional regulator [Aquimarina sp. EL_32]MBG6171818.1 AcrR family transcriptional regulator [Aquimarina sp. EL_43]